MDELFVAPLAYRAGLASLGRREIDSMKKEVAAIKEEFHFFPFFIDLPSFFISSTHSQTHSHAGLLVFFLG